MEIEKLIEQLQKSADFEDYPVVASFAAIIEKKYLREAATALEQLQAENDRLKKEIQQMRWIPVEERLPEENVTVLAFNADPHAEKYVLARYRTVVYLGCYWCQFDQEYDSWCASCWKVTHWMPLPPSPPAKGENCCG